MPTNMTLATNDRELLVIYDPESSIGKQALGYAKSSTSTLKLINLAEAGLTGTQWSEVADLLGASIDKLVSKDHPNVDGFVKNATMSDDHWIKFIQNNPSAIQNPILIQGKRAKQITTPSQVMQFIEVDSAGLEKHNVGDAPDITPNTTDEHQID